jgi:hypothetical protein
MIRIVRLLLWLTASGFAQNPNTPAYPTTVATDQNLLVAKRLSSSTLASNITNSTLTVPVADGTQFLGYELIRIDNEEMKICSIASNTLTLCSGSRGWDGTTAAAHLSGASVRGVITATHHNQLAAEVKSMQAVMRDRIAVCADAGSTDDYACSPAPSIGAYTTSQVVWMKANTANTGAATANFNALGPKTIKKTTSGITTDLATNDIRAGQWVLLVYDGTNFQMASALANAAGGTWGSITGTLSAQTDLQSALDAKLAITTAQVGTPWYCRSTTGNDGYTCTVSPALGVGYTRGQCLTLDADTANTGPAALTADGFTSVPIVRQNGDNLQNGDVPANKPITVCNDGTNFVIQGGSSAVGGGDALISSVQSGAYLTCNAGSGGTPHTCNLSPAITGYTDGMVVRFVRTGGSQETGVVTLNINSLGAKNIKVHGTTTDPGNFCNVPAGPVAVPLVYNAGLDVFWMEHCVNEANRGDAVAMANLQRNYGLVCTTGGTATAYTCSLNQSISGGVTGELVGYADKATYHVKMHATSGADATIEFEALGARNLYRASTSLRIQAGELVANNTYALTYNSSLNGGSGGFEVRGVDREFHITRTSNTVLTIDAGNVRVGSVVTRTTAICTVTLSASTGATTVYIYAVDGTIYAGYSSGLTLSGSGCSTASGVSAFPSDSVPLYTWGAGTTSGQWDAAGTDYRAKLATAVIDSDTGIVATSNPTTGRVSIAYDPLVLPSLAGTNAFTGVNTTSNLKRGSGSPEGAVTGSIGDIYQRTNGGASTTLYVKESGNATNTGWIAYGAPGGGGSSITAGTYASKPGTCTSGDLYLLTNSLYQMLLCGASNVWYHHADGKRINTLISSLSWTNVTGGSSEAGTVTETYGYTTLNGTSLTQLAPWTRYATAPSAPYVRTWILRPQIPADNYGAVFVGWRDSSTTLMQSIWLGYSGGTVTNGLHMKVFRQAADGSGSSDDVTTSGTVAGMLSQLNGGFMCLRLEDNNTNRIFSFAADCATFTTLHTEARTTYVANPNQLVMGLYGTGTANQPPLAHFLGFLE